MTGRKPDYYRCHETGQRIRCLACFRTPSDKPARATRTVNPRSTRVGYVCDYHGFLYDYVRANVTDEQPFNMGHFVEAVDWVRIKSSCQPEITLILRDVHRVNQSMAMRVV